MTGLVPATSRRYEGVPCRRYEGVPCPGIKAYPAAGSKAWPAQVRMLQELPYQGLVAGTRPATTPKPLMGIRKRMGYPVAYWRLVNTVYVFFYFSPIIFALPPFTVSRV